MAQICVGGGRRWLHLRQQMRQTRLRRALARQIRSCASLTAPSRCRHRPVSYTLALHPARHILRLNELDASSSSDIAILFGLADMVLKAQNVSEIPCLPS